MSAVSYFDTNRILCAEDAPVKWAASAACTLSPKAGFAIVYDVSDKTWKYQSTAKKDWNDYLISIGRLRLSDGQKMDSIGNIVTKTQDELFSDGLVSLDDVKSGMIQSINRICSEKILSGFNSSALGAPHFYDSEETDQLNLIGCAASGISVLYKCVPENQSAQYISHTSAQIKQVLKDGIQRKTFLLQNALALKLAVSEAADISALRSINIKSGWEQL